jgi:23S rRNA (guanosine2251-2'-O)-methyltransferase
MLRKYTTDELLRMDVATVASSPKLPLVLVMDNVRSALNVGSAFRTSDAFAVRQIILCGISAVPPHREIAKTALGATETVAWQYFQETSAAIAHLRQAGYAIWVVEQALGSTPLQAFQPAVDQPLALIFGNEVSGVGDAWIAAADGAIEIPQYGAKHSLNVSVCVGVVVWEIVSKLTFH